MMRASAVLGVLFACTLLAGCLVPKVHYDAELARNRALVIERTEREARLAALERRIRDLEATGENLELERSILNDERVKLIDDLEDLRIGNQALNEDLEEERAAREATEIQARDLSGTYGQLIEALEQEVESGQLEIHRLKGRLQVRALDQHIADIPTLVDPSRIQRRILSTFPTYNQAVICLNGTSLADMSEAPCPVADRHQPGHG